MPTARHYFTQAGEKRKPRSSATTEDGFPFYSILDPNSRADQPRSGEALTSILGFALCLVRLAAQANRTQELVDELEHHTLPEPSHGGDQGWEPAQSDYRR